MKIGLEREVVVTFLGEFFGSWRVIEGPHGWLDMLAGFRYTYLGEQVGLQANNMAINAARTQLIDQFAGQLTSPGSGLRTLFGWINWERSRTSVLKT